jgi:predicted transcriptional regulator
MQKEKFKYRQKYHPNAFLERKRNVTKGLKARTKILEVMSAEEDKYTIRTISRLATLSYSSAFHHLLLLEKEEIVKREGKRPYKWKITGKGQKKLDDLGL